MSSLALISRRAAALLLLTLAPGSVRAQGDAATSAPFDSTHFRGLQWRVVGPVRGGRSIAAAGSPSRPNEYYFGATGGGLWKTTDGGLNWRPVTDGQIRSSSVGAVGVSESNPDVVYIGMGEVAFRGNIMQGDGVYRSADSGKTWKHVGLAETQAIARVRVDRTNPDVVYVAALGHPFGPNPERGVFRTRDGGATWQRVLFRNDSTGAVDLVIDPGNPRVLYASLWQAYRTPWTMSSGGPGSGLFKSTDGGDSWTELTRNPGLPRGVIGKIGVTVSGADSRRVYAIVESDSGGVFRSDDGGATWRRTNDERKLRQRAFYYSRIYADPKSVDRVYVLNVSFWRSDDGGVRFDSSLAVPHGDNHDLWIDPANPQRMIESNDGGGTVSTNGGRTWTDLDFPTAQLYHVATTTDFPYHVCGAQQDNSTLCAPSSGWGNLAQPDAAAGAWFYEVGGGESGYIAPDPANPDVFYAGSQGALLTRHDRRTGQVRDVQVYPRFFSGEPASALPERWQWTYPIVFSPLDPKVLYTSSQHLWRTTNQGQSWERISPDLTRADPATLGLSGGPITHDMNGPEIYGTIFTIAPSPLDRRVIWTGSDDGLVHVTRDGGKSWQNMTPPELPPFSRVSLIDASPHAAGAAYLAAKRYQLDDRAPFVYKTADYGKSWTRIVAGIRADDYVHAVREDPTRRGLLYAGAEHGVYVSFDDGARWQSLSLNLPDVQVSDLVVEKNDLVIATHGRSMQVLDDIQPLRELSAEVARADAHLYRPREVTRGVNAAVIQYHLARAADTVKVDILDAKGAVVRSFVGTPERSARQGPASARDTAGRVPRTDAPADSLARRPTAPDSGGSSSPPQRDSCETGGGRRGRGETAPPTVRQGLNRFVWDLRYPGASSFECMIIWSARPQLGPAAPPGRYQVRLTANGRTLTQPLTVRRDPRLKGVTDADLREQFALAVKVRDRTTAANDAVVRIRRVRRDLAERAAKGNDARVAAAADSLRARLTAIEEELYQVRNRSGQDPLNFPIKLNNRLAALRRSIETGDARPTAGAYRVFTELSAELDARLAELERLMRDELPRVNALLGERGLDPVRAGGGG
ncbi:MAG TPA: glycosyl hydrolase [Gemmatimonadaceae bacterium]|nr:glycosyl hydrolase [Gemmatimonadaceae bacterium]